MDQDAALIRLQELETEVAALRSRLSETSSGSTPPRLGPEAVAVPPTARRGRPVRSLVLDVLDDLGCSAYSREISQLLTAVHGRDVPGSRFGVLSSDEAAMHVRGGPRPVYLCHVLTAARFEPIKRLWARSDWPLEERVFAPTTGRLQHLKVTARLCRLAERLGEQAADPTMLRIVAADHARDLPGARFRRGEFPLREWANLADGLVLDLLPADLAARADAAERLGHLGEHHQMFGRPELMTPTQETAATERDAG